MGHVGGVRRDVASFPKQSLAVGVLTVLVKGPRTVFGHVVGCVPSFLCKYQRIRDGPSKTHGKMTILGIFLDLVREW